MRIRVTCDNCKSDTWIVTVIDGERLSLKCFMCDGRKYVKYVAPQQIKLTVD